MYFYSLTNHDHLLMSINIYLHYLFTSLVAFHFMNRPQLIQLILCCWTSESIPTFYGKHHCHHCAQPALFP